MISYFRNSVFTFQFLLCSDLQRALTYPNTRNKYLVPSFDPLQGGGILEDAGPGGDHLIAILGDTSTGS